MRFGFAAVALLAATTAGITAQAQQPTAAAAEKGTLDTLIQEAKADYTAQKSLILAAAEKMPEENYSAKPTPEIRSYGELFTHVAQAQNGVCATISGQTPAKPAATAPTTKADITAALKASFDVCDAAVASVTAANALDVVGKGYFHGTKVGLIQKNTAHDNEMYGTMSVYMRLKSVVPPSTAMRGRM